MKKIYLALVLSIILFGFMSEVISAKQGISARRLNDRVIDTLDVQPYNPIVAPPLEDIGCLDNEVVVALTGGTASLRAYNFVNDSWTMRPIADIPSRVEALSVGDVTHDGKKDIVVGLWPYVGNPGAVRVYSYENDSWSESLVNGFLDYNVEAIAIGDADNDGHDDIVAGLEGSAWDEDSRVRVYSLNGTWDENSSVAPGVARDVQAMSVVDIEGDGENEIVVLYSNHYAGQSRMEIVRYNKRGNVWVAEQIVQNIGGYNKAERMIVADFDEDGRKEIVVGAYRANNYNNGTLFMLRENDGWMYEVISNDVGIIDGMSVGIIDDRFEIIVGDRNKVKSFSFAENMWEGSLLDERNVNLIWDVKIGDADNDGIVEILSAADRDMVKITNDPSSWVLQNAGRIIDSIVIDDVDERRTTCA